MLWSRVGLATWALAQRSERRNRQRAANRGAILAAARRVAEREGAHLLSLRAAAAEAGYAPASGRGRL